MQFHSPGLNLAKQPSIRTNTLPTSRFRSNFGLFTPSFMPKFGKRYLALLGRFKPKPVALTERMESIRELMLEELGDYGEKKFPAVVRRVRNATDVQGLWYARADLMAILANAHGERIAREKVIDISNRFKGLLPPGLTNRGGLRAR